VNANGPTNAAPTRIRLVRRIVSPPVWCFTAGLTTSAVGQVPEPLDFPQVSVIEV
jgi:hypothetical protein